MNDEIIRDFSVRKDKKNVQEFYHKALDIIVSAIEELKLTSSNTINLNEETTRIFPMGDYTNDTFIDKTGELEIVIATFDPQIILNNKTFINARKSVRRKKDLSKISSNGTIDQILFLLLKKLTEFFDETTTLFATNDGIKILCFQEYGFKLLIRFATYNVDDKDAVLYFWDPVIKNERAVNLFLYNEEIDKKDKQTNGNYKKIIRIYKNIRKTILVNKWSISSDLNKYFIELIVYNIPDLLMMENDIVKCFYKSYNYLINSNILNFKSFDGKNIQSFNLAKISYYKIHNFIRLIKKLV